MPDATITSTASTFGTISGTFAADQSTVTGTITGTVTGTLTGSVGVPGPQGPTGATGATGAQGPQGDPGAPGQGVPVGGTAGQFLYKIDGTNYNTDWTTVNLSVYAVKANNLSDLADAPTARTNLGLGSLAVVNDAPSNGSQYARKNAAWDVVIPGDRYLTTSTTSNTVSNGNKTFTIGTGLSYTPTQNITISYDASNHMHGEVLTYNSGTGVLTVDINNHTGSGTYTAWVVNVGGVTPATSVAWGDITGTLSSQTDLQSALDLKLDVSTAASTYYLQTNPSGFIDASALTGYATETFVTSQGYITDAPSDGSQYARQDGAWSVVSGGGGTYALLSGADFTGRVTFPGITGDEFVNFSGVSINTTSTDPTDKVDGDLWIYDDEGLSPSKFKVYLEGNTQNIATESWVTTSSGVAPLASPVFTGNPTAPTPTSTDNDTSIATTAFVKAQAYAKLASPTFTGTPTLPTGTIATTQSPGNNTTALATTAFVTAAVPAFATTAQAIIGTSSTTALAPSVIGAVVSHPELRPLNYFTNTAVSGSGAVTSATIGYGQREMYLGSLATGRACWQYGIPGANANNMSRADWRKLDFSKKVWMSGKAMVYSTTGFGTSFPGDANTFARITLGGYPGNATGDMTIRGIGWKKQGGSAPFFTLTVHNGTTLTDVASTIAPTDNQSIDWLIFSDGTGNVTLYINGAQAATTSAGPTGITTNYTNAYREQVEAATTPAARQVMECTGGFLYIEG